MKAQNPHLKAAFMKASMAEQEEAHKHYKLAIDLYKEAVELLIPVAEGKDVFPYCRSWLLYAVVYATMFVVA